MLMVVVVVMEVRLWVLMLVDGRIVLRVVVEIGIVRFRVDGLLEVQGLLAVNQIIVLFLCNASSLFVVVMLVDMFFVVRLLLRVVQPGLAGAILGTVGDHVAFTSWGLRRVRDRDLLMR